MNVLFICLEQINNICDRGLYTDFLREVVSNGHSLTVISAKEKRNRGVFNGNYSDGGVSYLFVKTGTITKNAHFISKGISIVLAGWQYLFAIKKEAQKYDMVICTTPCITFERAMRYAKKKGNAKTVLLLKDLWPYDLVFNNVLTKTGWKRFIYKYLEGISTRLFDASDVIGCMTPRNKTFVEEVYNNGQDLKRVCVIPNSIEPLQYNPNADEIKNMRSKYKISEDKTVFVYGGNLGVAQGTDFIIDALSNAALKYTNAFFMIVGSGTDYVKIETAFKNIDNVLCMQALPHDEYERLVYACDVGLIFLNWNCHSPNSPSRVLQYLQASKPIICAVDDTTDVGTIAADNGIGLHCDSNDADAFVSCVGQLLSDKVRIEMGQKARTFFDTFLTATKTYELVFERKEI